MRLRRNGGGSRPSSANATAPFGSIHTATTRLAQGGSAPALVLNRVLIDLSAADPLLLDAGPIVRDCEYVRDLILKHPDAPRQRAAAFRPDADPAELVAAASLVKAIGLTEEQSLHAGDGPVLLVVALLAAIAVTVASEAVAIANGIT